MKPIKEPVRQTKIVDYGLVRFVKMPISGLSVPMLTHTEPLLWSTEYKDMDDYFILILQDFALLLIEETLKCRYDGTILYSAVNHLTF